MTEAVKVRDWLAELGAAAEAKDRERFMELVEVTGRVRPDLGEEVCGLACGFLGISGEKWARSFFVPTPQPIRVESGVEVVKPKPSLWSKHLAALALPKPEPKPKPEPLE